MKKIVLFNSLVFTLAAIGATPSSTPVIAQNSLQTTQIERSLRDPRSGANFKISQTPATQLRVVQTGKQPRQKLRLKPIPRAKQTTTMTVDMNAIVSVGGQSTPQLNSPKSKTNVDVQVIKVDDNGDFHADFVYTNTEVIATPNTKPEQVEQMRSYFKKIEGFKGTIVSDYRGNVKEVKSDIPENIEPDTKQILEQTLKSFKEIFLPLPTEAVGIGAEWQIINNSKLDGINIRQTETYELIERKNNTITLAVNVEQNGGSQKINMPQMPAGTEMEIVSLNGNGRGKIKIDLNKIMPINSTMSVNSDSTMKIKNTNTSEEITLERKISVTVSLESN
ncbi:MAG: hypothetical protein QNJ54_19270 [Prochloraceae cyanobacterium]|nr:hypothetical protein [Prochloraceae cyanobacterium]